MADFKANQWIGKRTHDESGVVLHGVQLLGLDKRLLGLDQASLVTQSLRYVRDELERADPLAGGVGQGPKLDFIVGPRMGGVAARFDECELFPGNGARPGRLRRRSASRS